MALLKLLPLLTVLLVPVVTAEPVIQLSWGSEVELVAYRHVKVSTATPEGQSRDLNAYFTTLVRFPDTPLPKFGPDSLWIPGLGIGDYKETDGSFSQGYIIEQAALFRSPDPFNQKYWTCTFTRTNPDVAPFSPPQQRDLGFDFAPTAANGWAISEAVEDNGDVITQCKFGKNGDPFPGLT